MKAKEFYENLENKKDFTKLTSTGISSNYENVFEFAESYAKSLPPLSEERILPKEFSIEETESEIRITHKDIEFTSVISKTGTGATRGQPTATWKYIQWLSMTTTKKQSEEMICANCGVSETDMEIVREAIDKHDTPIELDPDSTKEKTEGDPLKTFRNELGKNPDFFKK